MNPTATVRVKSTSRGRIYFIEISDGRTYRRSSTREKAAAWCPLSGDKVNLTLNAAKLLQEAADRGWPGTLVNLETGEVMFHRSHRCDPTPAEQIRQQKRSERFRRRHGLLDPRLYG